jgi:hypothetical protein
MPIFPALGCASLAELSANLASRADLFQPFPNSCASLRKKRGAVIRARLAL